MSEPKDITVIPEGHYCYTWVKYPHLDPNTQVFLLGEVELCPYWKPHPPGHPEADGDAYCEYLDSIGEYDMDVCNVLLWDQCKECGVNIPEEED